MAGTRNGLSLPQWYGTPYGRRLLAEVDGVFAGILAHVFGRNALVLECCDLDFDGAAYASVEHVLRVGPRVGDVRARFDALPIESGGVSLVVVMHALEYGYDADKVVDEVARVLESGGHALVLACNATRATPGGLHAVGMRPLRKRLSARGLVLDAERCIGAPLSKYSFEAVAGSVHRCGLWADTLCRLRVLHLRKQEDAVATTPARRQMFFSLGEPSPAS